MTSGRYALLALAALGALAGSAAAHDLRGNGPLLAKGGKVQRQAPPRWRTRWSIFRPKSPARAEAAPARFTSGDRARRSSSRACWSCRSASKVDFPNQDPILHNVFSVSGGNTFDLGLYRQGRGQGGDVRERRAWCACSATSTRRWSPTSRSLDTPYFASPDASGAFTHRRRCRRAGHARGLARAARAADAARWRARQRGPLQAALAVTKPRMPPHINKLGKPLRAAAASTEPRASLGDGRTRPVARRRGSS